MISAFGVEHGDIAKGLEMPGAVTRTADRVAGFGRGLSGKPAGSVLDLDHSMPKIGGNKAGLAARKTVTTMGTNVKTGTLKAVKSPSFKPAAIGAGAGVTGGAGLGYAAHRNKNQ